MEDKRISEYDNLAAADIEDTDLLEIGRPSIKNFKLTWANLRLAVINFLSDILLGKEDVSNKKTNLTDDSDTFYVSQKAVKTAIDSKQDKLVSGTNIKTINSTTLLGSGNIEVPQNLLCSTTSTSSLTPDIDNYGVFKITALDEDITINNPTSNASDAQMMMFIIKDDGTSRTISWGSDYANGCVDLPTATTASKWLWILIQWDRTDSKGYCISVGTQS